MRERTIPPSPESGDESVAHFITRRFGPELFQMLVEPLLAGIYAGDAGSLSLEATFPQLRELERRHGSLLKGMEASAAATRASAEKGGQQAPVPPFLTLRDGMEQLIRSLVNSLSTVRLRTKTPVRTVEQADGAYQVVLESGERLAAEALILATPASVTSRLTEGIDRELAALHASIPFASSAIIHLAFRSADLPWPLEGHGYLIPNLEESELVACTWSSSKWEGRAPAGWVLLRLYAGRFGRRELVERSDDQLVGAAREEIRRTLSITAKPSLARVFRWPQSIAQYTLDHPTRVAAIGKRLALHPGLGCAGSSYRGVGIPDCIESGFAAADAAVEFLRGR